MGMRGLQDWMRSHRNVEATHSYVARTSQFLGLRGQHPPGHGDAGATCECRNVGSNKIYGLGVSECLGMRGQHTTPHGDAGATRLGTVLQECGSNTQLCSQGIPMPGNVIHGIEAVSTSHIGLGIAKRRIIQSVLQTPAWGCGGYE